MDYIVPGILQARILEWVAFPFSRETSGSRDRTRIPAGGVFTNWATREALKVGGQNYFLFPERCKPPLNITDLPPHPPTPRHLFAVGLTLLMALDMKRDVTPALPFEYCCWDTWSAGLRETYPEETWCLWTRKSFRVVTDRKSQAFSPGISVSQRQASCAKERRVQ